MISLSFVCEFAEAYDAQDPDGNITIKWDVISWTPHGYVVRCPFSYQSCRLLNITNYL
ncbi:hypothetical protein Hdeb2414_s0002g00070251 [Helianthus debilis subsp. tardiflorus]